MEGDTICLNDVFRFNQTGLDEGGHACGQFEACGVRPLLLSRLKAKGMDVPLDMFKRRTLVRSGANGNV
jgi:pilus assembly protein CpaF